MVSALTISLALYLFLIILPGYIFMIFSGYIASEKGRMLQILIRGSMVFLFVNIILMSFGNDNTLQEFMQILKDGMITDGTFLIKMIALMFITSLIFGYLQLVFDYTLTYYAKKELNLLTPFKKFKKKYH